MKRKFQVVTSVLFIALFLNFRANAQDNIPRRLDSFYVAQANLQKLVGNVLISQDNGIIFKKSFGYQNTEKKIPNTDSSAFAMASVTKIFTATAVLQLKEKGLLQLDDNYVKYFIDFPFPEITIRQLLSHTSGLPAYELFDSLERAIPEKIFGNEDIIPALKLWHKPLHNEPGEGWYNSGMNYCLLAMLVEKLSGQALKDYFRKNIFEPADMPHSYLENYLTISNNKYRTINYETISLTSSQLERVDLIPREKKMVYNYGGFIGDGGLITTAGDMAHFDAAYFSGKLINYETMEEAMTPVKLKNGNPAFAPSLVGKGAGGYGLGWSIGVSPSYGRMVWHDGAKPGVRTIYIHNLTKNQTVFILENIRNNSSPNVMAVSALNIINGLPEIHD